VHPFIEDILAKEKVVDAQGLELPLSSSIDRREAEFLATIITSDSTITQTLEVGCAHGISSLTICSALAERAGARHTIVDPFQRTHWRGVGVTNLQRAALHNYELIEQGSEFALPKLALERPRSFDFIFIDGFHTFDHTLIDLFYSNLLVRIGGIIVVDDCKLKPVAKAVSYFSKYPAYQLHATVGYRSGLSKLTSAALLPILPPRLAALVLPGIILDRIYLKRVFSSMAAFKKVSEDERPWNWFQSF
jgi:predicted O-methyltransferase YrrM